MRKHNYLIGYEGEGQVAYGKGRDPIDYLQLMTLHQAKQALKNLGSPRAKKAVFKLVRVK